MSKQVMKKGKNNPLSQQKSKAAVSINEDDDALDPPPNYSVSTNGPAGLFNMDWGAHRLSDASLFVPDEDEY